MAHGDLGFFSLPARVDVAPVTMGSGKDLVHGFHWLAGLYWASMTSNTATPADVGVGYVQDRFWPQSSKMKLPYTTSDPLIIHGVYLEAGQRAFGGVDNRAWLNLRVERLFAKVNGKFKGGVGLTGRAAWEIVSGIDGDGHTGAVHGTVGIGAYFEVGVRHLPSDEFAFTSSVGLSARTPFMVLGR